jgi:RNA polymerase sigma-70 factor (ECF subfamily)
MAARGYPGRAVGAAPSRAEQLLLPHARIDNEAEDAVQGTMLRAWQALATFEDRGQLRAWLYRIATNVCIDMVKGRSRRGLPMHVAPVATSAARPVDRRPEAAWVQPAPDSLTLPAERDQAEHAVSRESVRIAFIAALQYLPPRQRVVHILRHLLGWRADEALVALFRDDAIIEMPALRSMATWKDEIRRRLIAVGGPSKTTS